MTWYNFYSLNATQTLMFGYIKCTTYVFFTISFLDIVYGPYVRQWMCEIFPPKTWNKLVVASVTFY